MSPSNAPVGDSDRARDQAEVVDVGHARARRYRQRRIVLGIESGCGGRQSEASLTATISMVVVAVVTPCRPTRPRSSVRCGLPSKFVGLSLVDSNATVCSSAW
jgi:hypothetical protein